MAKIVDVATLAGVSTATVSRVLNGTSVRPDLAVAVRRAGPRHDAARRALGRGARRAVRADLRDLRVPASHLVGGYAGAEGWRLGRCSSLPAAAPSTEVSKPGEIVWSRVYIAQGALHVDIGRGSSVELPEETTRRR